MTSRDEAVSVRELRANLADYLRRAHDGEPITVTRHGRPDVVIGPVKSKEPTDDE